MAKPAGAGWEGSVNKMQRPKKALPASLRLRCVAQVFPTSDF